MLLVAGFYFDYGLIHQSKVPTHAVAYVDVGWCGELVESFESSDMMILSDRQWGLIHPYLIDG